MKTPHCDLATGKIYGCKRGSFLWWHEKGHFEFNRLESTSNLNVFQQFAFTFWMFSISLSTINKYMLFIVIPSMLFYLGVDLYEEIWCNRYANSKTKKSA